MLKSKEHNNVQLICYKQLSRGGFRRFVTQMVKPLFESFRYWIYFSWFFPSRLITRLVFTSITFLEELSTISFGFVLERLRYLSPLE